MPLFWRHISWRVFLWAEYVRGTGVGDSVGAGCMGDGMGAGYAEYGLCFPYVSI